MNRFVCVLCLLVCGCGLVSFPDKQPDQPSAPTVKTIALGDITEALADEVPASISDSDQLILVLNDLVTATKLTNTQASQIKSALSNIGGVRPLTEADAKAIREVK